MIYKEWRLSNKGSILIHLPAWISESRKPVNQAGTLYPIYFTDQELSMLKFLIEELYPDFDDPYNDWSEGVQRFLGDIVYNKLDGV